MTNEQVQAVKEASDVLDELRHKLEKTFEVRSPEDADDYFKVVGSVTEATMALFKVLKDQGVYTTD